MTVSQAEFARLADVSRASICGKIKNKTLIVDSGGMLDTDNPVNREYLNMHQQRKAKLQSDFTAATPLFSGGEIPAGIPKPVPAQKTPPRGYTMPDAAASTAAGIPEYMLGLTIRELITQYGTLQNVEKYVKILRDLTAADEKDQRMQERRMTQIPKDFVTSHIFELLEQMSGKMLDMPDRVVDSLIALAMAGADENRQKIINNLRDNISVIIADTKDLIVKQLESLRSKYDDTSGSEATAAMQDLKEQMNELLEKQQEA